MCKPMGNLAENLNLGNRFRPPPPDCFKHCRISLLISRVCQPIMKTTLCPRDKVWTSKTTSTWRHRGTHHHHRLMKNIPALQWKEMDSVCMIHHQMKRMRNLKLMATCMQRLTKGIGVMPIHSSCIVCSLDFV